MITCSRRRISCESLGDADEQHRSARIQSRSKEGPDARAFSWGLSYDKYGAAAWVCPKRHARLSATTIKHQNSRKVAHMAGRQQAPARFRLPRIDSVTLAGRRHR